MGLTNEGANFYALERAGEKPFSPNMGRNHKAEGGFYFTVTILEVYLHSKFRAGSGQSPVFLSVFVVLGVPVSQAAPGAGE